MRIAKKIRETNETYIEIELGLDNFSKYEISTGNNFLDHMLREFSLHGQFDLKISAKSKDSDQHHLVEDIAITLGSAFKEALGDKVGIERFADITLPMDEALIHTAIDISGRPHLEFNINIKEEKIGDFEVVLLYHFLNSFVQNAGITLHINQLSGCDPHHIIEATFKSFARSLKTACSINHKNQGFLPSTKGSL